MRRVFIKEYYKTHGFQDIQRSGFHASSDLIAEQMTRVVSYMMIGRITRTVSTIIKYVLLISEIGSCVIYVYIAWMYEFCVRYMPFLCICIAEMTMKVRRAFLSLHRCKKYQLSTRKSSDGPHYSVTSP